MFKGYKNIAPPVFIEIFSKRNLNYGLHQKVHNKTESQSFLGSKILGIVVTRLKEMTSLNA